MNKNKADYLWEGLNPQGLKLKGEIRASSLVLAKAELIRQGLICQKIRKKRSLPFNQYFNRLKAIEICVFSQQLATAINAGIPLIQALELAEKSQKKHLMKTLIEAIRKDIGNGLTFAEALQKHPRYFSPLFSSLIELGEKSGTLDTMLNQVATYQEKVETIKKKIKKTLSYPLFILIFALGITIALLTFVVPQFEILFHNFGAELPALTRAIIHLSSFFQHQAYLLLPVSFSLAFAFIQFKKRTPGFKQGLERLALKLPLLGSLMQKASIARFSRTLAISFAAGLPLVEALKLVAAVAGNSYYRAAITTMGEEISRGQTISQAMQNSLIFPDLAIQMLAIGEESGSLEQMLIKIAAFYEEEVNNIIDSLSNLLEPLIMAFLGILVGGLVIAMYLPIFKLGSVL